MPRDGSAAKEEATPWGGVRAAPTPPSVATSLTLLDCLCQSHPPGEAWERFVRLYTPLLYEWARRQGFKDADQADLTQEVLIKLLRKLPE